VSASGGTPAYTGTGTKTVSSGDYSFTVTDANGCTATTTGNITQPSQLTASSTPGSISCYGGTTTVSVSASGGTPAYRCTGTKTVSAGNYSFTVTDANGCTATTTGNITQPSQLTASSTPGSISCYGGTTTVSVSASGGTPGYTGTGTQTVSVGNYSFTVTDANGCTATTTGNITQPSQLTASSTPGSISCYGGTTTVSVSASGGTPAYRCTGTKTVSAGNYSFTVTDANGCTATTTGNITQPTQLTASSTPGSIGCYGGTTTVSVSASGGTPGYTGTGTQTVSVGNYSFTVTDANGCTATTTGNITQPTQLTASSTPGSISCYGGTTTVSVSASGGTPAYTGTGTKTVSSGTYSYTVTDKNGCTATTTGNITQPSQLTASSTPGSISCYGGTTTVSVSASGGTPGYTGTGTKTVGSGTYSYTVTDKNGCTATTTGNITQPATPLSCGPISGNDEVVAGTTGIGLDANASGGTPSYTYHWTNNNSAWVIVDPNVNPVKFSAPSTVSSATFGVVVTDANGCKSSCTFTVMSSTPTLITDTMRCTLQNNCGSSTVNSFRLIFTQDAQNFPCYKLNASNPGQFYYNVFFDGTPGQSVTVSITLPYPFVTQGANPIEVYDGATTTTSGSQTCIVPNAKTFAGSTQVTLANYGPSPVVGVTTWTTNVTFNIPPHGGVYLAIHLDYGLKKATFAQDFMPDSSGNALLCGTTSPIIIPNGGVTYNFATGGAGSGGATVSSCNDFKKTTGTAGIVQNSLSLNPVPGSSAVLKDSKNTVLGSAVTDSDGWYVINYKWTGKAATFYVTMTPPPGYGSPKTQTITLKSNGFIEADFTAP
jgi:hypothetical protein